MNATDDSESLHATCPGCGRTVRIPASRLQDNPRCPSCRSGIFLGAPVVLDDQSFDQFLSRNDLPILVDFWAPWCGPCRTFAPVIEEAARAFASHVIVAKVNSDEARAVSQRLQIQSIPTVALFMDGREIGRRSGAMLLGGLSQWMSTLGVRRPAGRSGE